MNGRYMRAAEIRWHKRQPESLRHIHQEKEKKKVSTVQIFDADLRFVNEIPMPNTLAGIGEEFDQLADALLQTCDRIKKEVIAMIAENDGGLKDE